jgi:uncharacterized membrane protein
MTKKEIVVPVLTFVVAGGALFGVSTLYAQTNSKTNPMVTKIAQRFGLKESEVQAVFDEERQEQKKQLESHLDDRLSQAVKDRKITEVQKTAILSKIKELQEKKQTNIETWKNMSAEQRRAAMQKEKDDLKTWADHEGISLDLFPFGMKGHRIGRMRKLMN